MLSKQQGQVVSTEPTPTTHSRQCVVFFGGSFTFGTGVEDWEKLPSQVQSQLDGTISSINLGLSGYGPHHMLAMLEQKLETTSICHEPIYGIYHFIPHHISRAAGTAFWDSHDRDPRYTLQADRTVKRTGSFLDYQNFESTRSLLTNISMRITAQFHKSVIAAKAFELYHWKRLTPVDITLFVSIVDKAKRIFEERYTGSQFLVIYWDLHDEFTSPTVLQRLQDRDIQVILVSTILPLRPDNYIVERYQNHPPPETYQLIARHLVQHVFTKYRNRQKPRMTVAGKARAPIHKGQH